MIDTKKRLLVFALACVLCLNISLVRPKPVHAFILEGITAMEIIEFIAMSICGSIIVSEYHEDCENLCSEFTTWLYNNHPTLITDIEANLAANEALSFIDSTGVLSSAVVSVIIGRDYIKQVSDRFVEFLRSKGVFSDYGTFTYTVDTGEVDYSNLVNLCNSYYRSYYGVSADNSWFANSRSGLPIFDLNTNRYITIVGNINEGSFFEYKYLGVIACPNSYFDIKLNPNGNGNYVLNSGYGRVFPVNDVYNLPYYGFDLSKITILAQFYYNPSATGTAEHSVELSEEGRDYVVNPSEFMTDILDRVKGQTIVHYPDGTTSVEEDNVALRVPTAVDETTGERSVDTSRTTDLDNALDKAPSDVYEADPEATAPAGSQSWYSSISSWLSSFWDKLRAVFKAAGDAIVLGIKNLLVPDPEDVRGTIATIRADFESKLGYEGFDLGAAFGSGTPPEDVFLSDYPVGGGVSGKLIDFSFVLYAVGRLRGFIRGLFALLLFIYNLNQIFSFIGAAPIALGSWQNYNSGENSNSLPSDVSGWLARGGKFRQP